jgi:hypothetical protein
MTKLWYCALTTPARVQGRTRLVGNVPLGAISWHDIILVWLGEAGRALRISRLEKREADIHLLKYGFEGK